MKKIWMPIVAIVLFFLATVLFTIAALETKDSKGAKNFPAETWQGLQSPLLCDKIGIFLRSEGLDP
jgi:hypothetical protein